MNNDKISRTYFQWVKYIAKGAIPNKADLELFKSLSFPVGKIGFIMGKIVLLLTYPISVPLIAYLAYWSNK